MVILPPFLAGASAAFLVCWALLLFVEEELSSLPPQAATTNASVLSTPASANRRNLRDMCGPFWCGVGPSSRADVGTWRRRTCTYFDVRGLSASWSPSPTMLKARTVIRSARPGKTMNHQASWKMSVASEIIAPHEGFDGSTPTPRNDRAAS